MTVGAPDLAAIDLGLDPREAALVADEVAYVRLLGLDVVELEYHQVRDPAIDAPRLQQHVSDVGLLRARLRSSESLLSISWGWRRHEPFRSAVR